MSYKGELACGPILGIDLISQEPWGVIEILFHTNIKAQQFPESIQ
jgi:hypothetical protein